MTSSSPNRVRVSNPYSVDFHSVMLMEVTGDEIAETIQRQFDSLPQKRKPQARGNGLQEWVPLSGIVAQGDTPIFNPGK